MADDSTIVITDIKAALSESDLAASGKPAALLVVGGDLNGTLFDLTTKETTAGRNPDNNIQLEYPGISRHHLKVSMDEGGGNFSIEDLGSKNGTYLNNQKLNNKQPLKKGDIIKIGSIAFKYIPEGDPERNAYDKLNLEPTRIYTQAAIIRHILTKALRVSIKNQDLQEVHFHLSFLTWITSKNLMTIMDMMLEIMSSKKCPHCSYQWS